MPRENQTPGSSASEPGATPHDQIGSDTVESSGPDAQHKNTPYSDAPESSASAQRADSQAAGEHAKAGKSSASQSKVNARVKQSNAPVDVPRTPNRPTAQTEDVAAEESKPPKNPDDGSVWSDTELPAPNKKGVRTSLF